MRRLTPLVVPTNPPMARPITGSGRRGIPDRVRGPRRSWSTMALVGIVLMLGINALVPGVGAIAPPIPNSHPGLRGAETAAPRAAAGCRGTLLQSNNTSGPRLTVCTFQGSNASALWATLFENLTGNYSTPLTFVNNWGDGTVSNVTLAGNPTRGFSHTYWTSGSYRALAGCRDQAGVWAWVNQTFTVNVSGGGRGTNATALTASLFAGQSPNVVNRTDFAWTVQGGLAPYTGLLSFGDGTSLGSRNYSIGAIGYANHTYPHGNGSVTYTSVLQVWDSGGNRTSASWNVTPNYTGSGNTSGVAGTVRSLPSGLPFGGVNVSLCPASVYNGSPCGSSNRTDPRGAFFLPGAAGAYVLTLVAPGYNNSTLRTVVTSRQVTQLGTLFLSPIGSSGARTIYGNNTVWIDAANGSVNLTAHLVLEANASAPGFQLIIWANLTGQPPVVLNQSFGDGTSTRLVGNATGPNVTRWTLGVGYATHVYNTTGPYSYVVTGSDANGSRIVVPVSLTYLPGRSGNGTPPTPVNSVVIDASSAQGTVPLSEVLQAFISGGSAPFTVAWSLPGSNRSGNISGLEVLATYPSPGWFPATAFVYNTTSAAGGRVLVGFGSTWIDVLAASGGGGNGSGNHSGNGSGNGSGGRDRAGGTVTSIGSMLGGSVGTLLLLGLAAGVVLGAIGGYRSGVSRYRPRDSHGNGPRGPIPPQP